MNFLIILLLLAVVIAAAAVEIYRELHHFQVTRYSVVSPKLSSLPREIRILFLSDLHNRTYGRDNETLLTSIRNEKPDLILIGGDMLVGKENAGYDTAVKLMKALPALCPVIFVNGNHEQRMKEDEDTYGDIYSEYQKELKSSGVRILENENLRVELGDRDLMIYGLELPSSFYQKFKKLSLTAEDIEGFLGSSEPDRNDRNKEQYTILLAHNPAYMDAYLDWGADMVLSGHLHGGLVRVPWFGGIVTPQGFLFPHYSGEMTKEGDQTVIVSRGLGTHTLNIRLFNMPELISIRLGGNVRRLAERRSAENKK